MDDRVFIRFLIFSIFIAKNFFAQDEPIDSNMFKGPSAYEYILLDTTSEPEKLVYKPIIGIGRGFFTFLGDVRDNYFSHPTVGQSGWNFNISRTMNKYFNLNFNVIYGNLTGNTQTKDKFINFKTDLLIGGVFMQYNFRHLIKKAPRVLPTLSLGIESFEFNSKADLKDADGNYYYYWDDGTIRNVPQTDGGELNSIILHRDYIYETDLRELNLDGLGKYPLVAFAFPIDFALEYKMTHRLKTKVGVTYHFTNNDNIDNVSSKGIGSRKGNRKGDHFLYTYFTISYDLFSPPKLTPIESHFVDVNFAMLDEEDEDGDGVIDLWDESPGTPSGVKVDSRGRPLDSDHDGIPDFRDDEPNSNQNAIVNLKGVTYTDEELIVASQPHTTINMNDICNVYPSLCPEKKKIKTFKRYFEEMPAKFKPVDLNSDGYISIEEINIVIDKFFDMQTNLTIEDIYELNDYFFDQ